MIHPRRLKGTPDNLARYYSIGDYYAKGGDAPSAWGGRMSLELGLAGQVEPNLFRQLLSGRVGGQQLGRHRGKNEVDHRPGWDFAVNAPKSVSIMALVANDDRIATVHERAVGAALGYLEEHAMLRRRVNGQIVHETTGRLIYAQFTEHASRELDPHLHTHVVVLNMTRHAPGDRMSSLETRAMYAEQMAAGQVYRNELAHGLRELGYRLDADPKTGLFEIAGVPRSLIRDMSRRAGQIDAHAREHGLTGQAARRVAFYETRGAKEKIGTEQLQTRWAMRAEPYLASLDSTMEEACRCGGQTLAVAPSVAARAMLFGLRQAEANEAVSNLGDMLRLGLASHLGEVRLTDILPYAETHAARRKLLTTRAPTGDRVYVRGRTTRRTARLELALSHHLALALNDAIPIADEAGLRLRARNAGLTAAQEAALLHLGLSNDRVVGVQGVAGAGKSTLIRALAQASGSDVEFVALAPTSSAAASLGTSARIPSRTVASLLAGGPDFLDSRHVLVLDEAGQLGNRQAVRMLEISHTTGARLILLGDDKQTGAIEQGKPFWLMQQLGLPTANLTYSVRQETRSMKIAVTQARGGDYAASLASLDKVISGHDAPELAKGLVREWARLKPESRVHTSILVLENATRLIINAEVRKALKAAGDVVAEEIRTEILTPAGLTNQEKQLARFYTRGQVVIFSRDQARRGIVRGEEYRVAAIDREPHGRSVVELISETGQRIRWDPRLGRASQISVFNSEQRELAVGDRIQWRLVNHELGVRNADRGTVEALKGKVAFVRWDREGRLQQVDLARHKNWDHGYCETVFSAQSKTYDRVYVLAPVNSALVTGQNYYTAITRARFGVKLWTEDPQRLVDKLERKSGEKSSALEGLGRLERDGVRGRVVRLGPRLDAIRRAQAVEREARERRIGQRRMERRRRDDGLAALLAGRAASGIEAIDRWLASLLPDASDTHAARVRAADGFGADRGDQSGLYRER